jgi:predicted RNA-binding protein YlxR (DUF448 family)
MRMCIGCRERVAKSLLLRVVAEFDADSGSVPRAVPDVRGRRAGRGASLHPTRACLDLAERRKAFPRAFRLAGPLDTSALRDWVTAYEQSVPTDGHFPPGEQAAETDRK